MNKSIQHFAQKAIIFNEKNELLLIRYGSSKYVTGKLINKYALAGGKILIGQTVDDSIIDEVQAETGGTVKPGLCVSCWNWEYYKEGTLVQINAVSRSCKFISGSLIKSKTELETTIDKVCWIKKDHVLGLDIVEDELPSVKQFINNFDFYTKF